MSKLANATIWEGVTLCVDNAHKLFESAELLGKQEHFSTATSLMILATEECIKSYALLSRVISLKKWDSELQKYFRNHQHKHNLGGLLLLIGSIGEEVFEEVIAVTNDTSIPREKEKETFLRRIHENLKKQTNSPSEEFLATVKWHENADELKKRGFYVDFTNKKWISPSSVTEETYAANKSVAKKFLWFMQLTIDHATVEDFDANYKKIKANKEFKAPA
ncbi:AbiV family abortive infection protein [Porticoccus sp.]